MSVSLLDAVDLYIPDHLRETELYVKLAELMRYVVEQSVEEFKDVKYKYKDPSQLSDTAVKNVITEQGFDYIVDVMNTMEGLEFNTMLSFMDLVNQLKGTREGLELVLKLMGFDSIVSEWWEDEGLDREAWSYEIVVIVNSSNVPDIYETLEKVKEFSDNYVLSKITNINVRFSADKFAELGAIMGGFAHPLYSGKILQRL